MVNSTHVCMQGLQCQAHCHSVQSPMDANTCHIGVHPWSVQCNWRRLLGCCIPLGRGTIPETRLPPRALLSLPLHGSMKAPLQRSPFCPMVVSEAESPEAGFLFILLEDLVLKNLSNLVGPKSSLSPCLPL